ncbi:MAG: putative LPS assembly protein LptD, partial [bacterium]
ATSIYGEDSTKVFRKDGLAHSGSFSANAKLFRYFNLNPSLNWDSDWVRSTVHYVQEDRDLVRDDKEGLFTRTTFSLGTSVNTKLYGMARHPLGIGASFRHTMTPSVGFRYRPDFSDEKWGYYETVEMSDGRSYTYDRFEASETASNIGGTPRGLSESLSFGLGHLFQMKTGSEENENEKKFDLLNVSMNSGLDLKRDSLKWDDLRMTFRSGIPGKLIGPFESLSFDVGTTHSWYAHNESNGKVNTFFFDSEGGSWFSPLELTNMNTNVGISLRPETIGALFEFGGAPEEELPDSLLLDEQTSLEDEQGDIPFDPALTPEHSVRNIPPAPQAKKGQGPTQLYQMPLDIDLSFHQTRDFLRGTSASNRLSSTMRFELTPRWKSSMNFTFDLDEKKTSNASVTVTRDLHCWEASFQWSPLGFRPGYFLRIGLRSPQLKDVKIERHRGGNIGGFY